LFIDDPKALVTRHNIVFGPRGDDRLFALLGNGLIGGCVDELGMSRCHAEAPRGRRTVLAHRLHHVKGYCGYDFCVPLAYLQQELRFADGTFWQFTPADTGDYRQVLDLWTATLETSYTLRRSGTAVARIVLRQATSKSVLNSLLLEAIVEPLIDVPFRYVLGLTPVRQARDYFRVEEYKFPVATRLYEGALCLTVQTNSDVGVVGMLPETGSGATIWYGRLGVEASTPVDRTTTMRVKLLLATSLDQSPVEETVAALREGGFDSHVAEHEAWWRDFWQEHLLGLSQSDLERIYIRSNYYLGANHSEQVHLPTVPMGLTSMGWSFHFPQDFSFVFAALLKANHLGLAGATSDYWSRVLPGTLEFTRRHTFRPGAFFPWEMPYEVDSAYAANGVPNLCSYEYHNSAYVSRMCYEYYLYTGDKPFLLQHGYPVIKEIATFYRSMLESDPRSGKYRLATEMDYPQDEGLHQLGGNVLSTLISAEYALRVACEAAQVVSASADAGSWREVLEAGLDYDSLDLGDQFAITVNDHRSDADWETNSNFVQFNGTSILPMSEHLQNPKVRQYHQLFAQKAPVFSTHRYGGWALGAMLLSAVNLRQIDALERELAEIGTGCLVDADLVSLMESTSPHGESPYFLTTMGLVMNALCNACVQDTAEGIVLIPAVPTSWYEDQPLVFKNIRSTHGLRVSGKLTSSELIAELEFTRACRVTVRTGLQSMLQLIGSGAAGPGERVVVSGEAGARAVLKAHIR
jgi:hypothetical protein